MKKPAIIVVLIAFLVLLARVYLLGPSSTPLGQEHLTMLSNANFREFGTAFDGAADVPRMVLLLSPT